MLLYSYPCTLLLCNIKYKTITTVKKIGKECLCEGAKRLRQSSILKCSVNLVYAITFIYIYKGKPANLERRGRRVFNIWTIHLTNQWWTRAQTRVKLSWIPVGRSGFFTVRLDCLHADVHRLDMPNLPAVIADGPVG